MKEITLSKGFVTLIDDEDFDRVSKLKWSLNETRSNNYARSNKKKNQPKHIYLHHFILGTDSGSVIVDHINGNGLDNRKENLRICNKQNNCRNSRLSVSNTSGYKGVVRWQNKWRANICLNGKTTHLGMFIDIKDAAKAYNEAAIKYFGEFAKLNKV